METDELGFDELTNKLNVQVTVRCGEFAGVDLTTIVPVEGFFSDPQKARVKISAVIDSLLKALPMAEIKGLDEQYATETKNFGVDAEGKVTVNPLLANAQAALRKKIEDKKQEPPTGA